MRKLGAEIIDWVISLSKPILYTYYTFLEYCSSPVLKLMRKMSRHYLQKEEDIF